MPPETWLEPSPARAAAPRQPGVLAHFGAEAKCVKSGRQQRASMTFPPKDKRRGRRNELSMLSARAEVLIHVNPRAARSALFAAPLLARPGHDRGRFRGVVAIRRIECARSVCNLRRCAYELAPIPPRRTDRPCRIVPHEARRWPERVPLDSEVRVHGADVAPTTSLLMSAHVGCRGHTRRHDVCTRVPAIRATRPR